MPPDVRKRLCPSKGIAASAHRAAQPRENAVQNLCRYQWAPSLVKISTSFPSVPRTASVIPTNLPKSAIRNRLCYIARQDCIIRNRQVPDQRGGESLSEWRG